MKKKEYIYLLLLLLALGIGTFFFINEHTNESSAIIETSTKDKIIEHDKASIYANFPSNTSIASINKTEYLPGETIWFSLITLDQTDFFTKETTSIHLFLLDTLGNTTSVNKRLVRSNQTLLDLYIPDTLLGNYQVIASFSNSTRDPILQETISIERKKFQHADLVYHLLQEMYSPGDNIVADIQLFKKDGSPLSSQNIQCDLSINGKVVTSKEIITDKYGKTNISETLPSEEIITTANYSLSLESFEDNISFEIPILSKQTKIDLQFFPKSGSLIKGIPNTIALKAYNGDQPTAVEGFVLDKYGTKITNFSSDEDGTGIFNIIPYDDYRVLLTKPWGNTKTYKLPDLIKGADKFQQDTIFG